MARLHHVLESQQFAAKPKHLFELFASAEELRTLFATDKGKKKLSSICADRQVLSVFGEESTRTRLSFEMAARRLGATVTSVVGAKQFSSFAKGETTNDAFRIFVGYQPDALVLRYSDVGAAALAAEISDEGYGVPVLNAGDGVGQHPTQALLDVYTIWRQFGRLDNLCVVMIGDLMHGRTVHSLAYLLGRFENNHLIFVSPQEVRFDADMKVYLDRHGIRYRETTGLDSALPEADVVYSTRIQTERMSDDLKANLAATADDYRIGRAQLNLMDQSAILMHPLPRVGEIATECDRDARAVYFDQAENGLWIRAALFREIVGHQKFQFSRS